MADVEDPVTTATSKDTGLGVQDRPALVSCLFGMCLATPDMARRAGQYEALLIAFWSRQAVMSPARQRPASPVVVMLEVVAWRP